MTLFEKIYTCRKKSGLSQEALAQQLGISRQAISKWETGESVPELGKLKLLADTFGVTTDWLLSEEEEPREEKQEWQQPQGPQLPGFLMRLVRKYGWLAGFYVAFHGLCMIGAGVLARYLLNRMFGEMGQLIGFNPVSVVATILIIAGSVISVLGVGLSLYLRYRSRKK